METNSEVNIHLDKYTEFTYVPVIRVSGVLRGLTPVNHEDSLCIKRFMNLPDKDRKLILKLINSNDESKIIIEEMVTLNDKMIKMNEELKRRIGGIITSTSVVTEIIEKLLKMGTPEALLWKRLMEFDSREWELVRSFIELCTKEKIFVINFMNWFHKQNHFGVLSKSTMKSSVNSEQSSLIESELRTLVSKYILEQGTRIKKIATQTLKQMSPNNIFNKCGIQSGIPIPQVDSNSDTSNNFNMESQNTVPVTENRNNGTEASSYNRSQIPEIVRKERDKPLMNNPSSTATLSTNLSYLKHGNIAILKRKPKTDNISLNRSMDLGDHQPGEFEKRVASKAEKICNKKSLENRLLKQCNNLQMLFDEKKLHRNIVYNNNKEIVAQNTISNNKTHLSTTVDSKREVSCNKINSSEVNNLQTRVKHSKRIPAPSNEIKEKKPVSENTAGNMSDHSSPSKFMKVHVLEQYKNRNKQNKPVEKDISLSLRDDLQLQSNAETELFRSGDHLLINKIQSKHGVSEISLENNKLKSVAGVSATNTKIETGKPVAGIQRKDMVHILTGTKVKLSEKSKPKQSGLGSVTALNSNVAQAGGMIATLDTSVSEEVSSSAHIKHVLMPVVSVPDTSTTSIDRLQSNSKIGISRIKRNVKILPKPNFTDIAVTKTLQNFNVLVHERNCTSPESRSNQIVPDSSNAVKLVSISGVPKHGASEKLQNDISIQKSSCEQNSIHLNKTEKLTSDVSSKESNKSLLVAQENNEALLDNSSESDLKSLLMSIKEIKEETSEQVQGNDTMMEESFGQEYSILTSAESDIALYPLNISQKDECLSSEKMEDSKELIMNQNLIVLADSAIVQNVDISNDRFGYLSSSETNISQFQDGNAVPVLNSKGENVIVVEECRSVTETGIDLSSFVNDARLHNNGSSSSSTGRNSRLHVSEQHNRNASKIQQKNSELQLVLRKRKSLEAAATDVQEGTSLTRKRIVRTTDNFRKRMLCRGRSLYVIARSIKQFFSEGRKETTSLELLNQAKEFHRGSKLLLNSLKRFLQKLNAGSKISKKLTKYRNDIQPLIRQLNVDILSNISPLPRKNLMIVKDIIKLMNIIAEVIKIAPKQAEKDIEFVGTEKEFLEDSDTGEDNVDLEVIYVGNTLGHETEILHTLPSNEKEMLHMKEVPLEQDQVSKVMHRPCKRSTLKACCVTLNDIRGILKGRRSLKLKEFEGLQTENNSRNCDNSVGFRGFTSLCYSRGIKRKNYTKRMFNKYKAKKLKLMGWTDVEQSSSKDSDRQSDVENARGSSSENIQITIILETCNITRETITSDINNESTSNVQMPCIKKEVVDESYDYFMNTSQGLDYDLINHNENFLQQMGMTPVKEECITEVNEFELVTFDDLNTVVYSVSTDGQTDLTNTDSEPIISLEDCDYQYDQDPLQINSIEVNNEVIKADDNINDVKYSKDVIDDPTQSQSLTGVAADIVQVMEKTLDKPPLPLEGPGYESWCLYTSALDHNYAGKFKGQKKRLMYSLQEKSIVNIHHYNVPYVQSS